MLLVDIFQFTLPFTNPVLIFSLLLFIILFAPLVLNKFKIPHLIGLIIAGALIGPNGFHLMLRDSSIVLFGTVGLLYIMFLAGLEIDLADFKKNSKKSLLFGLYTFSIPMTIGYFSGIYLLHFSVLTSILLASMFASHTLLTYPIVSKLGISRSRAVNITIGGTLITDTLALLVLAVIAGMSTGVVDNFFWIKIGVSLLLFGLIVMFGFPLISRWFFKRYHDSISQYIFVLGMVFLGAFLAQAAGVEAIIGAFLVGLALNKLIPHTSPLMNRVEFVGNALFIPFFLIGVGMLIDFRVLFSDIQTLKVALIMVVVATFSKFAAAWLAQKTFGYTVDERRIIFGLSNSQAAATLAAVLVGYNIILNKKEMAEAALRGISIEPERLLNENVLNGTIIMILVTCTIASIVTQKGAQNMALSESSDQDTKNNTGDEKILVPINSLDMVDELVHLSLTIKSKKNKNGLFALHVVDSNNQDGKLDKKAKQLLERAHLIASATDNHMNELLRYDLNIINGISNVVKEHKISDLILGVHNKKGITDNFVGNITEGLLSQCNATTLIYKSSQPLSTIKRHLILVPDKAEKELGFAFWLIKVWNIARNTGAKLVFYAPEQTLRFIEDINRQYPTPAEFIVFNEWSDFLIMSREIRTDDNLIMVLSRKERPSYHSNMAKIPMYLNKYFKETNYLLIYPMQLGVEQYAGVDLMNATVLEPLEKLDDLGKTITNLFKRR